MMKYGDPSSLRAGFPFGHTLHRLAAFILASAVILFAAGACGRKTRVAAPMPPTPAPVPPERPAPSPPVPPTAPAAAAEPAREIPGSVGVVDAVPPDPVTGPPVRIGLSTSASELRVSSQGAFFFQEKSPETPRLALTGEVHLRVELEPGEGGETFRVQVAALSREDSAEQLRRKLEGQFGLPVVLRKGPGGTQQVRMGEFAEQTAAQEFATGRLAEAGFPGGFVVRESTPARGGGRRVTLRGPERLLRVQRNGFLFFPAARDSFLRLDGKPYRGLLDVTLNAAGRLTVVNQLGMEEYLLGVVPAEMSPSTYPEPAALSAQAVAARTFALRNLGKYRSEGFDLTNDVRTQVYGGVAAERPMTNEVVRATAGSVIYYNGQPIDAMYSSTCGGRTEDFENVFDAQPVPYLKSVACGEAEDGPDPFGSLITGYHELEGVLSGHDGRIINHELELARVLGWCDSLGLGYLSSSPSADELRNWTAKARDLSGGGSARVESVSEAGMLTNAGFLRYTAERVFGEQEIAIRTSDRDAEYYLGNLRDGELVDVSSRRALAFLLQQGLWHPYPDNSARPLEKITRSSALSLLMRWGSSARQELLRPGVLVSAGDRLVIRSGTQSQEFEVADRLALFKKTGNSAAPVPGLRLIGNERLLFHVSPAGRIDFLEVELSPAGAASDRYSPAATWLASLRRREITEKLRPLAPAVGEIIDLRPVKIGSSGRAVRIQVVGTKQTVELNGYRVRAALGLRDTLFTISRTTGLDGRNEVFKFSGRGWGHGIGLCQVGAYGMAKAGRSWEEILKTYYTGVEVRRAY